MIADWHSRIPNGVELLAAVAEIPQHNQAPIMRIEGNANKHPNLGRRIRNSHF
jgi:hypothetical protein